MMRRWWIYAGIVVALGAGVFVFASGDGTTAIRATKEKISEKLGPNETATKMVPPPAVTTARVRRRSFIETVLVTGSLVPRDEIIVVPEVEGLRVVELLAEEGDRVKAGDVLARLEDTALRYQLKQSEAALNRANASIDQAKSQIAEAQARQREAAKSLERAQPLRRKNYIAESVVDQRRAAAQSAAAQVKAAEEGLRVAIASKAEVEARRRELSWRTSRAEIKAPVDGLIAKRNARIGEIAIGANAFSSESAMFRLIARGEVELDGEVPETQIAKVSEGQPAYVDVAGAGTVKGKVRLVSPEINKTTRLGRVRIFLGDDPRLKIGSFARGRIETQSGSGLSVPLSAVIYTAEGPSVLVVKNGLAKSHLIKTGLASDGFQEVTSGLSENDVVVAKSGTFLRDGDAVRPISPQPQVSEAAQ